MYKRKSTEKQIKANSFIKYFRGLRDPHKASVLASFFKTGKGEYGEGDIFWGITVPRIRQACKAFPLTDIGQAAGLLKSPIHEIRMAALFFLVTIYRNNKVKRSELVRVYLDNLDRVNNWDLVDLSAPNILGDYLKDEDRKVLYWLIVSDNLWERRVALLACFAFIREGDFADLEKLAEFSFKDSHYLIWKAAGWMLREAGKRDKKFLIGFLDRNHPFMPKVMLSYAIEKLEKPEKRRYQKQRVEA